MNHWIYWMLSRSTQQFGEVAAVGAEVTRFRVGDLVVVGNIVDSCGVCPACREHRESYCRESPTTTSSGSRERCAVPLRARRGR